MQIEPGRRVFVSFVIIRVVIFVGNSRVSCAMQIGLGHVSCPIVHVGDRVWSLSLAFTEAATVGRVVAVTAAATSCGICSRR